MVITLLLIGINHCVVQSVNIYVLVLGVLTSLICIPSGSLMCALKIALKLLCNCSLLVTKNKTNLHNLKEKAQATKANLMVLSFVVPALTWQPDEGCTNK